MTDKIQKIREEVEKLNSQLLRGACSSQIAMETMCKEEAYNEVLTILDTVQEEPVSEELEKEIEQYCLRHGYINTFKDCGYTFNEQVGDIARHFAKWQKEQFEKNRLAACDKQTEEEAEIEQSFVMSIIEKEHRQPTFNDAIKYGMKLQKEKMIAEAIDVEVKVDAGGYPYIDRTIELYDYDKDVPLAKEGDKYKVILIKEG